MSVAASDSAPPSEPALPPFGVRSSSLTWRNTLNRLGTLLSLGFKRRRSTADYQALQRFLAEESVRELSERGIDLSAARVLEVAAGRGGFSQVLAEHSQSFLATDLHEHESFAGTGIAFREVDVNAPFPFADASFDLVYSTSLIEHLDDPTVFLDETRRVLAPGGHLYLSFPPFYSLSMVGGHQFKPFHLLGERSAVRLTNRIRNADYPNYADAYGDFGLVPLRISDVREMLDTRFEIDDVYTRFSSVNTARWPGWLADLATWHVCFLCGRS